ncbi:MAG: hypothetical protein WAX22_02845 [Lactococcus hircilactis]|uniref:hypothetical protein n=1 Tax=Lactococcus hircilactis TaxID=1494462 RepID=UPI003BC2BC00
MKKSLNRSVILVGVIFMIVLCLIGFGAAYFSGIGAKAEPHSSHGTLVSSKLSQSSKAREKGSSSKVSSSTSKKKGKTSQSKAEGQQKSSKLSTTSSSSSQVATRVDSSSMESSTAQAPSNAFVAYYGNAVGYSSISSEEALKIAKSIAESQKDTQDVAQQPTQESTQQEKLEAEAEQIASIIKAQNPDAQVNIIRK